MMDWTTSEVEPWPPRSAVCSCGAKRAETRGEREKRREQSTLCASHHHWLDVHTTPGTCEEAHPSLGDRGEDGSADHGGVGVEPQVIQQQAGGQQHGHGVCCVAVSDALPGVPGALQGAR